MGDFNVDVSDPSMTSFCTLFKLRNIVKEPTSYENPKNPSCIYFFFLQKSFEPLPPKIIKCKNYKNFDEDEFRYLFKMTSLNFLNKFANLKKNIWELITPILLKKNLVRQSCKNQGFVMHILKIKLEQLG